MSMFYPHPQSHSDALRESRDNSAVPTWPHAGLDDIKVWGKQERLLLSCLKVGDDKAAHLCLERLTARFGTENERVPCLKGMYQEAVAEQSQNHEEILTDYTKILAKSPSNGVRQRVMKR